MRLISECLYLLYYDLNDGFISIFQGDQVIRKKLMKNFRYEPISINFLLTVNDPKSPGEAISRELSSSSSPNQTILSTISSILPDSLSPSTTTTSTPNPGLTPNSTSTSTSTSTFRDDTKPEAPPSMQDKKQSDPTPKPIGTIRFTPSTSKISRLAVQKEYRKYGFGKELMFAVEKHLGESKGDEGNLGKVKMEVVNGKEVVRLKIHSQIQVIPFYEKLGYKKEGEEFDEDGGESLTSRKIKREVLGNSAERR